MIEFGNTLKQAREAKGLSLDQLSESTHIVRAQLEALENEKFDIFAAPVYVRGYIKILCEEYEIDHKPLIEEYMEILNGNREPDIKERTITSTSAPLATEPPIAVQVNEPIISNEIQEPIAEEPPQTAISMGSLFKDDHAAEPEKPTNDPLFSDNEEKTPDVQTISEPQQLSRYASPIREYSGDSQGSQGRYLRLGLLLAAVITVIYLIFIGIRALYRATTSENADTEKKAQVEKIEEVMHPEQKKEAAKPVAGKEAAKPVAGKEAAKPAAKAPAVKRTPQKIPSLYID